MKRNKEAGSQMTANQDENTCKKVLNRRTDKISRVIIDAESYFKDRFIPRINNVLIDCDTLQVAKEEESRRFMKNQTQNKIIEVA